jgi:hypothetical protein
MPHSPWKQPSRLIKAFYPNVNELRNPYGLYSIGMDRFFIVDPFDSNVLLHAARLLSSKFPSHVYVLPEDGPDLTNSSCLNWRCQVKKTHLAGWQVPLVRKIHHKIDLVEDGPPLGRESDHEMLRNEQEFILFVVRVCYALRIVRNIFSPKAVLLTVFEIEGGWKLPDEDDNEELEKWLQDIERALFFSADSIEAMDTMLAICKPWESTTELTALRMVRIIRFFFQVIGCKFR